MKLRFGLGTPKQQSLADIEREAAAEIQMRVDAGKPPREEWAGLEDRTSLDTEVSHLGQWSAPEPDSTADPAIPAATRSAPVAPKAAPEAASASKPVSGARPATRKSPTRKPAARQPAARKPATRSAAVGE